MTASTSSSDTPAIRLEGVSKRFGETRAVVDLSFEIATGQVVGFLGANGAGKSTTMKVLTGYFRPTAGRAAVFGHDVALERPTVQRLLGYLPETNPLYLEMAVLDFLTFVAHAREVGKAALRGALARVVETCGLEEVLTRPIGQLSRGYRQRVGLAQAMVHDPPLLILDEPTTGLDPNQRAEILELIRSLGREKTVLHSTHLLDEVRATCSRVVVLARGRLVAEGTPEEIVARELGHAPTLRLLWRAPAERGRAALAALPGVAAVERLGGPNAGSQSSDLGEWRLRLDATTADLDGVPDPREAVSALATREGWTLLELAREEPPLDAILRRLMAS